MALSRALSVAKLSKSLPRLTNARSMSGGGIYAYRCTPGTQTPKYIEYAAEGLGGLAWWWILWHLWTEPEHITGEFPYPDPSQWTNAELGIPED